MLQNENSIPGLFCPIFCNFLNCSKLDKVPVTPRTWLKDLF